MANFPNFPQTKKRMKVPSQSVGECAWGIFPLGPVGTVCGSDFAHCFHVIENSHPPKKEGFVPIIGIPHIATFDPGTIKIACFGSNLA